MARASTSDRRLPNRWHDSQLTPAGKESKIVVKSGGKNGQEVCSGMITVAIPSLDDRGLDSQVSGHFGRAPYFTVVKIEAGEVKEVKVLGNNAREGFHHEDLFSAFSREGVELIIAGGMAVVRWLILRSAASTFFPVLPAGSVMWFRPTLRGPWSPTVRSSSGTGDITITIDGGGDQ